MDLKQRFLQFLKTNHLKRSSNHSGMAVFHLCFFTILCSFFLAFFVWSLYVFLQGRFVKNLQTEKYFQTAVALISFLQKSNNLINFLEKGDCEQPMPLPPSPPSQRHSPWPHAPLLLDVSTRGTAPGLGACRKSAQGARAALLSPAQHCSAWACSSHLR